MAGLTTFSTMAYIIFVNPMILSSTGMDFGAVMVATILSAAIATFIMGVYANYPFALAPGMGLNAYFTYGVVLGMGHSWQIALATTFIAGFGFLVLNLLRLRELVMSAIPRSLRLAVTSGIGIFIAFIGLQNGNIIQSHPATLLTVGDITSSQAYLTGLGLIVTTALMSLGFRSAIFMGILLNWLIGLATGLVEWQGLVAMPPSVMPTLLQMDLAGALKPELVWVVVSFLFIAVFDTTGTLIGLAEQGGFVDSKGKLPRAQQALVTDAIGTMVGASLGTSPVVTYLESASGIAAGGRTGLTAVVVAGLFLMAMFFSPLAASIPLFATSPTLIIIGALMLKPIVRLDWDDPTEFIPAFVALTTIPFTFSIGTGIGLGFVTYALVKLLSGRAREVHWLTWVLASLFLFKFCLDP